jgi:peptidoglycan hydrolase CwlO-like protein
MFLSRWLCRSTLLVIAFALITTTSACVTRGTYDKKVAELERLRADHDHAAANREKDLEEQIDHLKAQVSESDKHISALMIELDELRRKVNNTTTLAGADDW